MKKLKFFSIPLIVGVVLFELADISSKSATNGRVFNIISCAPAKTNLPDSLEEITINDNRLSAGLLINGVLHITLEARTGIWYPETHEGSGLRIHAFAEEGKPMQLPGPLIRVPEGTLIKATIKNSIHYDHDLVLYGFYSRPGIETDSIVIAPGKEKDVEFTAGNAGTYFYRAYASDSLFDDLPFFNDSQLYGGFIIDKKNQQPDPLERILMIGIWNDTLNGPTNGGEELVMNGLTWPYTERLTYQQNRGVNWRVINASNQPHPMHLHGFFFTVNSRGNISEDSLYKKELRRQSVTELLREGETINLTWKPEREGNWLFHCHTLVHIMPFSFLRHGVGMDEHQMNSLPTHARDGMGGLIMGIKVTPDPNARSVPKKYIPEKQLTVVVGEQANYFDTLDGKGFQLYSRKGTADKRYNIPGPPFILTKGEPVAIKVINRLHEPTSIHWHGLEIESYFDGVAGWGNKGNLLAPLIQPGDSFIVHMTPPRAGTYIYHTHMHNFQLLDGMYGPLIVLNPGETFHPSTDKIFIISQGDEEVDRRFFIVNGTNKTDTMHLKQGIKYRFRIINITALGPLLNVSLLRNGKPVNWKWIANDGAEFPLKQQETKLALRQTISIGQTMDFEFYPKQAGDHLFELRNDTGRLFVSKWIQVD